ncbi:hypothetical protein [Bacillus sp. JJ1764]|uniref:hypothetical protein n=1 Tax=Bacillus sp. JJ1764 TaxID=3122964 RepID=UPI002FFE3928
MENTERNCCICGNNATLFQIQEKWICDQCLSIGNENLKYLWTNSIEKLLNDYTDSCLGCLSSDDPENIYKARILGKKIQSVFLFLGLPKDHTLLLPIRKVHLDLKIIKKSDVLLDEIAKQNEENKVNAEMVKLLTKKQKEANERLMNRIPKLINDSYITQLKTFVNEELDYYNLSILQDKQLNKYEERFTELLKEYGQSVDDKGKSSLQTIKILHKIRKRAITLSNIYSYLNDIFSNRYVEKEKYYKNIQHQLAKVHITKDWMDQLKTYENKIHAPKKEKKAVKNQLKETIKILVETVELLPGSVKED